jgi:hypothetical protein
VGGKLKEWNMSNNDWNEPPRRGEQVWVYYFNAQNRDGSVTANVLPRVFDRVIPNYLGKQHNLRWVLLAPGKPLGEHAGTAHRPEGVYRSERDAFDALRTAVKDKIKSLELALYASLKGDGVA